MRELRVEDAQDIQKNMNDKRMNYYIPEFTYPYSLEDAKNFISRTTPQSVQDNEITWAIQYEEQVVGTVNLHAHYPKRKNSQIGYSVSFEHAGKGIATEAVGAIISFAFETLGLKHIEARVFENNPGSERVLQKLGFSKIGIAKNHTFHRENMLDATYYGLQRKDFKN